MKADVWLAECLQTCTFVFVLRVHMCVYKYIVRVSPRWPLSTNKDGATKYGLPVVTSARLPLSN